jgi:hypothetical protein
MQAEEMWSQGLCNRGSVQGFRFAVNGSMSFMDIPFTTLREGDLVKARPQAFSTPLLLTFHLWFFLL